MDRDTAQRLFRGLFEDYPSRDQHIAVRRNILDALRDDEKPLPGSLAAALGANDDRGRSYAWGAQRADELSTVDEGRVTILD